MSRGLIRMVSGADRSVSQRFTVPFEYPVLFTRAVFAPENPALAEVVSRMEARRHRAVVIVDRGASEASPGLIARIERYFTTHTARLELAGAVIVAEGGEAIKNRFDAPIALAEELGRRAIDRQSFVVIVGGGALLDMAGYAAAICHRGVRVVRVPTTTLAQGDSGVGVKNGINAFGKKNFLGTFAPPFAVINDRELLGTLAPRDARAGISEAVKVGLIRDAAFFEWIVSRAEMLAAFAPDPLAELVERSARLHLQHIATSGDPFELGTARPLDFGHWAAHRLEVLSDYQLRHGEAVAIGIVLDTFHSVEHGELERGALELIAGVLERVGFELWDPALERTAELLRGVTEFREHLGGELTVTMLAGIGRPFDAHEIEPRLVAEGVRWLARRKRG